MNSLEYNTVAKDRLIREERCAQRKKLSKALNEIVNTKQPFRYGDGPEHDTWIYASFYSTQLGYKLVTAHPWILSKLISMRWIDPHIPEGPCIFFVKAGLACPLDSLMALTCLWPGLAYA